MDLPDAFGHTVFCDDIRFELGGKISLIGAYHAVLYIQGTFPFSLPKIAFAINYMEKIGKCTGPLTLKIFLPGDAFDQPTINNEIPIEELRRERVDVEVTGVPPPEYLLLRFHIPLVPVVFKEPGLVKVRAYLGTDEIRLGTLRVLKAPQLSQT